MYREISKFGYFKKLKKIQINLFKKLCDDNFIEHLGLKLD